MNFPEMSRKTPNRSALGSILMTDCYCDVTFHQFGLIHLGKDFCDTLREDVSLENSGDGYYGNDFRDKSMVQQRSFVTSR